MCLEACVQILEAHEIKATVTHIDINLRAALLLLRNIYQILCTESYLSHVLLIN